MEGRFTVTAAKRSGETTRRNGTEILLSAISTSRCAPQRRDVLDLSSSFSRDEK